MLYGQVYQSPDTLLFLGLDHIFVLVVVPQRSRYDRIYKLLYEQALAMLGFRVAMTENLWHGHGDD